MPTILATALLLTASAAATAPPVPSACSGHSPAHTIALLELYTSEGCSSCPPADQFVRGLRASGLTAQQVVPLSLHVDYWNDIGWKDPYSSPDFTERQRRLSALANSRTVYTPELFVGAKEQRRWPDGALDAIRRSNATPARAGIAIAMRPAEGGAVAAEVTATGPTGALLQVALVQNGLVSAVKRGENAGRTLHHDFVARQWFEGGRIGGAGTARQSALIKPVAGAELALTAFVQSDQGEILQAYSLPLCTPPR